MNTRDRTSEFFALTERIKKRQGIVKSKSHIVNKRNQQSIRSEFSRLAAQLSRNIASTSEKLEQLTYLTKSNNGLTENPTEINTLQQSIKQDITRLNQQIKILQSVRNGQQRSNTKQVSEHTNNVITSLQSKLADTSLSFKSILELEVEENIANRSASYDTSAQSNSPQPRRRANVTHHHYKDENNDSPQSLGIPIISPMQQQEQIIAMEQQNDRQLVTRSTAIEAIESTIAELGGIFQQLATMVAEQRETIQRIDQNTDDIEMNILGAQSELLKYYRNISTNRGFIIKLFTTIILLFLLFTFIM
ncbi:MAG: t-SNARE [Benjaminiella poitrasii]|nr:MAG: t-SNARE [Benjaminiella poitrasii]